MAAELICALSKDRLFSRILQERIAPLGGQVRLAADSGGAMKQLARQTLSLLICDLQSVGSDALKLCELVSQDASLRSIHCLLLHGDGLRQRFFTARAVAYDCEPFRLGEVGWDYLTEAIRQRLRIAEFCRERQVSRRAVPGRVLCVDRDRRFLRQLELGLRQTGLTVHCERSGLRAVQAAQQFQPGLILAEFTEAHWIMSQLAARDVSIPLIALADISVSAFPAFRADALELGSREVLRKPLNRDELMQAVQQILPLPGFAPAVAAVVPPAAPTEAPRHQPHPPRPHISLPGAVTQSSKTHPAGQPHILRPEQVIIPVEY